MQDAIFEGEHPHYQLQYLGETFHEKDFLFWSDSSSEEGEVLRIAQIIQFKLNTLVLEIQEFKNMLSPAVSSLPCISFMYVYEFFF